MSAPEINLTHMETVMWLADEPGWRDDVRERAKDEWEEWLVSIAEEGRYTTIYTVNVVSAAGDLLEEVDCS